MPIPKPGELDMYGNKVPDPPPPPSGPTAEQKLRGHYRKTAAAKAKAAAEESAPEAVGGAGLVRVRGRKDDDAVATTSYINPDHVQSVMPHETKPLEACLVVLADGTKYTLNESTESFTRRLAPVAKPSDDPVERIAEHYRQEAAAQ